MVAVDPVGQMPFPLPNQQHQITEWYSLFKINAQQTMHRQQYFTNPNSLVAALALMSQLVSSLTLQYLHLLISCFFLLCQGFPAAHLATSNSCHY